MKVIISGGGTGGHIFPAIAIADAIKQQRADADILFVGAEGKMEMERVPKAGYPIKGLWISGFHRQLTLRNLLFPFKLIHSLWNARRIIKSFKPDVVIGTGGYASGPTLRMAQGIKTVVQEQNSYAGVTNKLLAEKADLICVAYDKMESFFPKEKIVITGNPIRDILVNIPNKNEEFYKYFNLDKNKKTVLLIGGSLGARTLNDSMAAAHDTIKKNNDIQYLWQCGKIYHEEFKDNPTAQLDNVHLTMFINKMDWAYSIADIIISRAGAISISELCMIGKPTILVPSPNVAEDHQTKNAMALVEKEAAIMIKDTNAKKTLILETIKTLENHSLSNMLGRNIKQLAKPNAAKHIADEIFKLLNK